MKRNRCCHGRLPWAASFVKRVGLPAAGHETPTCIDVRCIEYTNKTWKSKQKDQENEKKGL